MWFFLTGFLLAAYASSKFFVWLFPNGIHGLWNIVAGNLRRDVTRRVPSPRGWPIVGHLPMLGTSPYLDLQRMGRSFDGMFQIRLGMRPVLVLDRFDTVTEALNNPAFAGRPKTNSFEIFKAAGSSYFGVEDATPGWKFLQRTIRRAVAAITSSKNDRFRQIMNDASESLLGNIQNYHGKPFKPETIIADSSAAIIGSVLFSRSFNRDDFLLGELMRGVKIALNFLAFSSGMDSMPFGKFFYRNRIKAFLKAMKPFNELGAKHCREYKPSLDPVTIADYLYQTARETTPETKANLGITDENILYLSQDIFLAGFAAVGESLHWLLNLMAACQDEQARVHNEINATLKGSPPTASDRRCLPYVEAVITEMLRFVSLQPLAAPHATMTNVGFRGYEIPARTMVFCNLWAVHHDPAIFENPDDFAPGRFLQSDGCLNQKLATKVIQFGFGKRRCPGELLARHKLFLLFTHILQKYSIELAAGESIDIRTCQPSMDRKAVNHRLIFTKRPDFSQSN